MACPLYGDIGDISPRGPKEENEADICSRDDTGRDINHIEVCQWGWDQWVEAAVFFLREGNEPVHAAPGPTQAEPQFVGSVNYDTGRAINHTAVCH